MSKQSDLQIAIEFINREIEWCMNNPDEAPGEEYQKGFIAGLKQAIKIVQVLDDHWLERMRKYDI